MTLLRRSFWIWLTLILGAGRLLASEQRDFATANAAFQANLWSRAEVGFAQFIEKHPKSSRVPEAALKQAQADFNQGKLLDTINLLQDRELQAGALKDQYVYWIGYAQFQNGDYAQAVDTFAKLARVFPDSQWRLEAVVNEAAARAKLVQWTQVEDLLQNPNGVFQNVARTNATDGRVLDGQLLLAQAMLAQNRAGDAISLLQPTAGFKRSAELEWRRFYLLCRARLANGETNGALALATNLIETASRAGHPDWRAESVAQEAEMLENMGRLSDAVGVYEENLTRNAPNDWQRQAILKIAELSETQTNFLDAENALQNFLSRFPNSAEADSVLLALGELHLKNYVAEPAATNDDLGQARSYFDEFIGAFTNSALLGNAFLDRGWCSWIEAKWTDSAADFRAAVENLPPSANLAVAHFKLGDTEFKLGDFAEARNNYQAVADDFTNYPDIGKTLRAQALYQMLQVCLKLTNFVGATNALGQILEIYPVSNVAEKSILLVGESLSDLGQPANARALFQKFEEEFPYSGQLPEVELAIARTYEEENNWSPAIAIYDAWVSRFANSTNLPAVEYARAWANFQGGRETNAFLLFTNFLAQFSTNAALAPVVQWWLGDYYAGQGDWADAEKNYELVFQNWPSNQLAYPAELMAGRAAMGRQAYDQATAYFEALGADTNCPPQLYAQALFALGDVCMQEPSPDTTNRFAYFSKATNYFGAVCTLYPGSEQAALAWGEIGDCCLQLAVQNPGNYTNAINAYAQVLASPGAGIAERSQAQLGIGLVLEKEAALTNGVSQTNLQQLALNNDLDVFFGNNLRDGETANPFWVKKAGLQALPLMETLGTGDPNEFIDQMETLLPQLKNFLEKKRLDLSPPQNQ